MQRQREVLLFSCIVLGALVAGVFAYQPLWSRFSGARPWSLGLDIAGGSYLVYDVDLSAIAASERRGVLSGLQAVVERRVNLFGVSEPRVLVSDHNDNGRLVIELAGVKDVDAAIREIGATPFLDFREAFIAASTVSGEATSTVEFKPTALNGRYVKGAQLSFDEVGQPVVAVEFNTLGARIFAELTEKNIGKPIGIFLDKALLEAPIVREKIEGGRAQISGSYTVAQAREFVERFNAGALPAPITLVNRYTISPELGADSLRTALIAGGIGTLLVAGFMVAYYRRLGLAAAVALAIYVAYTLAIFKLVPVTLTLAGIAGFILSIGMAVDANILVFERTREELRRGLAPASALEEGFRRAWTSIRDSNISTIITAFVLYYFTSSFVRGFALTLLIGVLISMFSALTVTRMLLRMFVRKA